MSEEYRKMQDVTRTLKVFIEQEKGALRPK